MSLSKLIARARESLAEGRFADATADIRRICSSADDFSFRDFAALARIADRLGELPEAETGFARRRIAVLGNHTTEPLAAVIRCTLLKDGIAATVYEAPYGAWRQELLNPESGLYRYKPDAVVIAVDIAELHRMPDGALGEAAVRESIGAEVRDWQELWAVLDARLGRPVLQHLFVQPEEGFIGPAERRLCWSASRYVDTVNQQLIEAAPAFVRWIDLDRLAALVGRRNWSDPRLYHHGKIPFSPRFLPDYSRAFLGAWRAVMGRTKKALVVDLDNTLWGGVIGDDGLEGIELGVGTAEGEAYGDFCTYLKALGRRGVILAVASKNDPAIAREVFERHSGMPLKLADLGAFVCSWNDKATMLRQIASELNIDISSLVFIDDNPAECELVRRELPEVEVIGLTGDPATFRRRIDEAGLFDAATVSAEDLRRSESYAARRKAAELKTAATDLDAFLAQLEMRGRLRPAMPEDMPRLAQMEMKTNQFNVMSRRLSGETLERLADDPDVVFLVLELADKFADHGLIASLIARAEGDVLRIESWLMSCRVFERTAEQFMINGLAQIAHGRGAKAIIGEYAPTQKNGIVAELYPRLAFKPLQDSAGHRWRLTMPAKPLRSFIAEEEIFPEFNTPSTAGPRRLRINA